MFKIESKSGKNVTLKYYREITPWEGRSFDQFFSEYDGKYDNILIRLHCYGGDVIEGNLIYNILTTSTSNVDIQVDGIAASMGAIFLLSGKKRTIAANGFVMLHSVNGRVEGNIYDMESAAKLMRDMEANFITKIASITKLTEEEVKNRFFDGADHWLNAKEAKELGLVHEIINPVVANIKDINTEQANKIGAKALFTRFAACLDSSKPNNLKNEMDKMQIIARYNLQGVTAESSCTAVMEALDKKLKAEEDAKVQAQNEVKAQKDAQINAVIDAAVKESKITAAQKDNFVKIGKSAGIEALTEALGAIKPHVTITSQLSGGGKPTGGVATDRSSWTWDDWQKNDSKGLDAMAKDDKETFNTLYKNKYGVSPVS